MIAVSGITIERKVASRSRKASREHECDHPAACRDFICVVQVVCPAVSPVTASVTPEPAEVAGRTSFRRVAAQPARRVVAVAGDRDLDLGDGAVGADVDEDGPEHLPGRDCPLLRFWIPPRLGVVTRRLDNDIGGCRRAGERGDHALVGLDDRQVAAACR